MNLQLCIHTFLHIYRRSLGVFLKILCFWSCDHRYGQRRCPHLFRGAHQGSGEGGGGGETEDSSEGEKTATQKQRRFPGERKRRKMSTACFRFFFHFCPA